MDLSLRTARSLDLLSSMRLHRDGRLLVLSKLGQCRQSVIVAVRSIKLKFRLIVHRNNQASALPLACPQTDLDPNQYSEDCLYVIFYVPVKAVMSGTSLSTLLW